MANTSIFRPSFGELVYADLPVDGSVQGGVRPVLIVQNDMGNRHSSTVEVLPLSAQINKGSHLPTHVLVTPSDMNGLRRKSIVLAENVLTIPMSRLLGHLGIADEELLHKVAAARKIQSPLPFIYK